MSGVFGDLTALGNFFSDELSALENFTNFLATDFENFINSIATDFSTFVSYLATAVSDIATFAQSVFSDIENALQNVASAVYPVLRNVGGIIANAIETALSDLAQLAIDATNALANAIETVANDFISLLGGFFTDAFQALGGVATHITPFMSQVPSFLASTALPYLIVRALPPAIDKLSELLPEFEIDLSPVGLGAKFNVKLGEIVKMFGENVADFMKEVSGEVVTTFREFLKEPFISNFKIQAREVFNGIGLGDLPFADPRFADIAKWVGARSYDELKPHFAETLLLTGFPAWFTNAYLESPVDDFVPRNPLFSPVAIRDVIAGVEYGVLPSDAVSKYAYNNLITPKTASLMLQNANGKLLQRAVEQGIRQFVVTPEKAYDELIKNINLTGKDLYHAIFTLEYQYAVQRIVRQFLRSLLSRALSNFGRPYIDLKYLNKTVETLFKELGYPENVKTVFETMVAESQLVQYNQLVFRFLQSQASLGIFDEKAVKDILKKHQFNIDESTYVLQQYANITALKEQLNDLKTKATNFFISDKDLDKKLKDLGFTKDYVDYFIDLNFKLPLQKEKAGVYLSLLKKGFYNTHEAKVIFTALGYEKSVIDELVDLYSSEIETELQVKAIQQKLSSFLLDDRKATEDLKRLHVSPSLIDEVVTEYFSIPVQKLNLRLLERKAEVELLSIAEIEKLLHEEKISASVASILAQEVYYEHVLTQQLSITRSFAETGVVKNLFNIPKTIYDIAIQPYLDKFVISTELEAVKEGLHNLTLSTKDAEKILTEINLDRKLIPTIINNYTPILFSIKTIAQNLIESDIYHVSKVPISVSHVADELKKLNVPDSQISALVSEIESTIGLEIWKKYLPSLANIETAIKTGYPITKLVQLSLIPAELLNLHVDLLQHQLVATEVQSLKTTYVDLLTYGINNAQLETMLRQYGINDTILSVLRLQSQLKKILTTYQELTLTPSKAMTIAEYVSNPDQLLQKAFTDYSVPADLQQVYKEYSRNRRVSRYISQIIETINLLFERKKISLDQAVSYLNQFKQYGLTDDEINLIKLNWQLRALY